MTEKQLTTLLRQVRSGKLAVDEAVAKLRLLPFEDLGYAKIDHHRELRTGFPEVIYCAGKTTPQVIEIARRIVARNNVALGTRCAPEVFAHSLYLQGYISPRDYETYRELYLVLTEFLPAPDLVIYLRASVRTLTRRIDQRGRTYERTISEEYLARLNVLYENWITGFSLCPVLTVPADDLDYVAHPNHLDLITRKVQEKLSGKEEVVFAPEEMSSQGPGGNG